MMAAKPCHFVHLWRLSQPECLSYYVMPYVIISMIVYLLTCLLLKHLFWLSFSLLSVLFRIFLYCLPKETFKIPKSQSILSSYPYRRLLLCFSSLGYIPPRASPSQSVRHSELFAQLETHFSACLRKPNLHYQHHLQLIELSSLLPAIFQPHTCRSSGRLLFLPIPGQVLSPLSYSVLLHPPHHNLFRVYIATNYPQGGASEKKTALVSSHPTLLPCQSQLSVLFHSLRHTE